MKHRTYWYKQPRNFWNEYDLFWAWNDDIVSLQELQENGYARITRKEAFHLCAEERYRRDHDNACAGYAPDYVLPYYNPDLIGFIYGDTDQIIDGYIIDV